MTSHKTRIHGRCPYAPHWDYYELTIETKEFIRTEDVERIADVVRGKEITQEAMAEEIRELLPRHCTLRLVGFHGKCLSEVTL